MTATQSADNSRPGQLRRWAEKREAKELPAHLLRDAADEIDRLRARLTTAEQDASQLYDRLGDTQVERDNALLSLREAEARVEAAEQALALIEKRFAKLLSERMVQTGVSIEVEAWAEILETVIRPARAALACPPQQKGE